MTPAPRLRSVAGSFDRPSRGYQQGNDVERFMRCWLRLLAALLALGLGAPRANANEPGLTPQEVVRRYSRTVACQIHEGVPGYRQYVTVTLEPELPDGIFGVWLVAWTGDLGCMGGNGTQGVQMALVKQNGFSRRVVSPVVVDAAPLPGLVMNGLRDMQFSDGVLTVRGTTGREAFGTFQELTRRYRYHGGWDRTKRFEHLP